jgi:DNA sulfur modification protein DndB
MNKTVLPALRSTVGDWITYVTTLSFYDVNRLIKAPDEIHERKGLSTWIQREAIEKHAEDIADYIQQNQQRFLGSLIIGVYDGNPDWAPLNIDFKMDYFNLSEKEESNIQGKLGLLHLSGNEKLFAIDGQHRVAGIKKALNELDSGNIINEDEVSAIFVAHDESTNEGKQRTRRLFTTVNKKAKRISKAATIALDEDNGFAIITRKLIDDYWLFEDNRNHISYSSSGSIAANDKFTITSVVGLYEIIKDLFFSTKKRDFESSRPTDREMDKYLEYVISFFDNLIDQCEELNEVLVQNKKYANYYRSIKQHLLFRPIGQRTFAKATQLLIHRGEDIENSITSLLSVNLNINSPDWYNILWDPDSKTMLTNKLTLAETQLLTLAGHEARSMKYKSKLDEFISSRDA